MKVLRLTNSNDIWPLVPEELRGGDYLLPDEVHANVAGQRISGELEGKLIAEAWLAAHARE